MSPNVNWPCRTSWTEAIFGNFHWPGASGSLLASSPDISRLSEGILFHLVAFYLVMYILEFAYQDIFKYFDYFGSILMTWAILKIPYKGNIGWKPYLLILPNSAQNASVSIFFQIIWGSMPPEPPSVDSVPLAQCYWHAACTRIYLLLKLKSSQPYQLPTESVIVNPRSLVQRWG